MTINPSPFPSPRETRPTSNLRTWLTISAVALLLTGIIAGLDRRGVLHKLDLQAFDRLVQFQHPVPPSNSVLSVDFDESTVRHYDAFPIKRLLLADVIEKIAAGKPSAIGLDIILDLPRTAADDAKLATTIENAGNVILVSEYGFGDHQPSDPLEIFKQAAAGVAFGDLVIDDDGAVRRMFLRVTTHDYKAFSLPVALASYASDQHLRPGGRGFQLFGSTKLPLASTNPDTAWVHSYPSAPTRIISVESLLAGTFDPSVFAGKVVLVGQSSEMGKDLFATPATRAAEIIPGRNMLSGAEIHAAATAALLNRDFLRTVHFFPRFAIGFVLTLCIMALSFHYRWYRRSTRVPGADRHRISHR